ncbi:MAG: DUF6088 family protein [Tannerellaceae bacterium]
MIIADSIRKVIELTSPGVVITINDFDIPSIYQPALVKALSRYVAKGEIQKISKGKYYKPKNTIFGSLKPPISEVVKDLLESNGQIVGYTTGPSSFADMGLTTQISSAIIVGSNKYRRPMKRAGYSISFLLQPNIITESNIPLLRILDAIRLFRDIPATSPNDCIKEICRIIKNLSMEQINELTTLSFPYAPYVRALLGAILENLGIATDNFRQTLNGVTSYKLPISEATLPTKKNWNIR